MKILKIAIILSVLTLSFSPIFSQGAVRLTMEEKQEYVRRHNYHRRIQGAPDMRWSEQLAKNAQVWANYLAKSKIVSHSKMNNYGENIAWTTGKLYTPTKVVDLWADEKQYYHGQEIDYTTVPGEEYGHYTQVIWSKSIYVGCAVAHTADRISFYYVCQYIKRGNNMGEKPVENFVD